MKLSETDLRSCYRAWHNRAGVFRSFVRATVFTSLQHHEDFEYDEKAPEPDEGINDLALKIQSDVEQSEKKQLILLDFEGVKSLQIGEHLGEKYGYNLVLISNGLCHDHGVIGSQEYKATILRMGQDQIRSAGIGPSVFLLDYGRYGDFQPEELVYRFNNQYELGEEDLPGVQMLIELGCEKVTAYTETPIKEDLAAYMDYLKTAGMDTVIFEIE